MSGFRQKMPRVAESVDLFKKLFGDDVKVRAASEGGEMIETTAHQSESELKVMTSEEFLAIGKLDRDMVAVRGRKAKRGGK